MGLEEETSGPRAYNVHEFLDLANPLCPDLSHFKGDQSTEGITLLDLRQGEIL